MSSTGPNPGPPVSPLRDLCILAINPTTTWSDAQLCQAIISLSNITVFSINRSTCESVFSLWLHAVWNLLDILEHRFLLDSIGPIVALGNVAAHLLNLNRASPLATFSAIVNSTPLPPPPNPAPPIPSPPESRSWELENFSVIAGFAFRLLSFDHTPARAIFQHSIACALHHVNQASAIADRADLSAFVRGFLPELAAPLPPLPEDGTINKEVLLSFIGAFTGPDAPLIAILSRYVYHKLFNFEYPVPLEKEGFLEYLMSFASDLELVLDRFVIIFCFVRDSKQELPVYLSDGDSAQFVLAMALSDSLERIDPATLDAALDFERSPRVVIALVLAQHVQKDYAASFIMRTMPMTLSPSWTSELKFLRQWVKVVDVEELLPRVNEGNLDAIRQLLATPSVYPQIEVHINARFRDSYRCSLLHLLVCQEVAPFSPTPTIATAIGLFRALRDQPTGFSLPEIISGMIPAIEGTTLAAVEGRLASFVEVAIGVLRCSPLEIPPPPESALDFFADSRPDPLTWAVWVLRYGVSIAVKTRTPLPFSSLRELVSLKRHSLLKLDFRRQLIALNGRDAYRMARSSAAAYWYCYGIRLAKSSDEKIGLMSSLKSVIGPGKLDHFPEVVKEFIREGNFLCAVHLWNICGRVRSPSRLDLPPSALHPLLQTALEQQLSDPLPGILSEFAPSPGALWALIFGNLDSHPAGAVELFRAASGALDSVAGLFAQLQGLPQPWAAAVFDFLGAVLDTFAFPAAPAAAAQPARPPAWREDRPAPPPPASGPYVASCPETCTRAACHRALEQPAFYCESCRPRAPLCLHCATQRHDGLGHRVVYHGSQAFECASGSLAGFPLRAEDALYAFLAVAEAQTAGGPPFPLPAHWTSGSDFTLSSPEELGALGTLLSRERGGKLSSWLRCSPLRRAVVVGDSLIVASASHLVRVGSRDRVKLHRCPLALHANASGSELAVVCLDAVFFVAVRDLSVTACYSPPTMPLSAGWTAHGDPLVLECDRLTFLGSDTSFAQPGGFASFCVVPGGAIVGRCDGAAVAISWTRSHAVAVRAVRQLGGRVLVSYSPSSGLVFASGEQFVFAPPAAFFGGGAVTALQLTPGPLALACAHGGVHVFQALAGARLVVLDFERARVSPVRARGDVPFHGLVWRRGLLAVGPRAQTAPLVRAREHRVPPSFWVATRANPDGVTANDPSVLTGQHVMTGPVSYEFRCACGDAIVGVAARAANGSAAVMLCFRGRRVLLVDGAAQIALAPDEVGDAVTVRVEAENEDHFEIRGLRIFVHCARVGELEAAEAVAPEVPRSAKAVALARFARVIEWPQGEAIDENVTLLMLEALYGDPTVAPFARIVLQKMPEIPEQLWVAAMEDTLASEAIAPELVQDFWNDFARLSDAAKQPIEALVWAKLGGGELATASLLSAFI